MVASRNDFTTFKGQKLIKTWYINQVLNGVSSPYDMTLKTVKLKANDRAEPPVELFNINPLDKGNGFVTFEISSAQSLLQPILDYMILEELGAGEVQTLAYGSAAFVDLSNYIPFRDIVTNEIPGGLVIPENYITIKAYEWRLYLQNAFEPVIPDSDLNNEAAWPTLVNFLIAKLVVHDYLVKTMKSLLASNTATDEANASGVKKIETGPSNAEFFDSIKSMSDFLKPGAGGLTAIDTLASGICQLATRLKIYLPMCKNQNTDPLVYIRAERTLPEDPITILTNLFPE